MSHPSQIEYPYEIIVVKHIPAGSQYVPADRIIFRHSWGPGDGRSYTEVYRDLNEFSALAIVEWKNPALARTDNTPEKQSAAPKSQPPAQTAAVATAQHQSAPNETETANWRDHSSHNGHWCKAEELPALRKLLLNSQQKTAVIGSWRFKLWGSNDDMISRWPHKAGHS